MSTQPTSQQSAHTLPSFPLKDLTNAKAKASNSNELAEAKARSETKVVASADDSVAASMGAKVEEESNDDSVQELLLAEVLRTWNPGKGNRQTAEGKSSITQALTSGIAPCEIAQYIVDNLDADKTEKEKVKEFCYNINKSLKKAKTKSQVAEKVDHPPTAAARSDPSPQSDLDEFIANIPYQQNGVVYLQGSCSDKKRKANGAATTEKKHGKLESMCQERHWMEMWKDARAELSKMMKELKEETDEDMLLELKSDIEALKRKKDEWAMYLGMKE